MSVADDVKQRLDIVSVVGSYVPLSRAGRNLKAACPFHQEKTPSFYVFPETQTWRCFGSCATGGDVFAFVMKKDGLQFGEALRSLAATAGITIEERRAPQEERDEHARLREAVQSAALFFHSMLLSSPEGAAARAYVEQRGISPEAVRTFLLGYSPAGWQKTADYLHAQGFNDDELLAAGLLTEGESGRRYDRFRDRLIFPIHDAAGALIGFGARALTADAVPKYLNSPQGPLFDKSANLYAMHLAKDAIRSARQAVIVEGYMDTLTAHQFGFSNVVASMGTALTEKQVHLLNRYTSSVVLALDADAAGESATLRGLEVAPEAMGEEQVGVPAWQGRVRRKQVAGRQVFTKLPQGGFRTSSRQRGELRILRVPEGKDPDELIRRNPDLWRDLVASSTPMLDFILSSARDRFDLGGPNGKADAVEAVLPFIAQVPNPVEQAHYLQRLATMVSVDEATLRASLPARKRNARQSDVVEATTEATSEVRQRLRQLDVLEDYCLALLIRYPHLAGEANGLSHAHFLSSETRELYERWETGPGHALSPVILREQGSEAGGEGATKHLEGGRRSQTSRAPLEEMDVFLLPRFQRVQEVDLPPMTDTMARLALAQCIHRLEERRLRELKAQQRLQLVEEEAEQGARDLALSAYERWKGQDPSAELRASPAELRASPAEASLPILDLSARELSVNRDLQELMRRKRLPSPPPQSPPPLGEG